MIVIDTHILVWWVSEPEKLSKAALARINEERNQAAGEIIVSAISFWEITMLERRGRIRLSIPLQDWFASVKQIPKLTVLALDDEVMVQAVHLPGEFHKDPADRFITAQARRLKAPLITADHKILDYPHVNTVW